MITRSFQQIVQMAGGEGTGDSAESLQIEGVSVDSRTISPGNLFIPLNGLSFDGHDYVRQAFLKGAAASLWQKDHLPYPIRLPLILVDNTLTAMQCLAKAYRQEIAVRVVGVTGSSGKTTTKDMIASILATTYKVQKTKGNFNNEIGLPLTLLQMDEDTQMAVLEMGMRGRGEIACLTRIAEPEVAVITNVGEAHIERLGTREEIARAKLEILEGLHNEGLFVYNGDDPIIDDILPEARLLPSMLRIRFGSNPTNDYYPTALMHDGGGTHFTINLQKSLSYYVPLPGKHNVINALSAIVSAKYMGVDESEIMKGLSQMEASGMRAELIKTAKGITIMNDTYNANPSSMRAAIQSAAEMRGYQRKILVLGDMLELGEQERKYHREIGSMLNPDAFDSIYTCGVLAKYIALEAGGQFPPGQVKWFNNKKEMLKELLPKVSSGDLVLVKGSRGMNLEEVVQELKAAH